MTAPRSRRPGELVFTLLLVAASLGLLASAYGISGFEGLSSAGAVPMAAAATLTLTALMVLATTARAEPAEGESLRGNILPGTVLLTIALIALYALLLKPVGFLPTSFVFLTLLIRLLGGGGLLRAAGLAALSVMGIYLVFRVVFTVLLPEGIVPEREILAAIGRLFGGR